MSRRSSVKEFEAMIWMGILALIVKIFSIFADFITIIWSYFLQIWQMIVHFFSSQTGLVVIIAVVIGIIVYFSFFPVFEFFYYRSKKFLAIKQSIDDNIKKCNLLNEHIEGLKSSSVNLKSIDFGKSDYRDDSFYNYSRPELSKIQYDEKIYYCSLSVCRNAQAQPFVYLCKYFNFPTSEFFLANLECVFNDFSAAEQGKVLLIKERNRILETIKEQIPSLLMKCKRDKLIKKLGFEFVEFNEPYFPKYSFRYISPGGNSSMVCDIVLDVDNIERFIKYIAQLIDYKKSIKGQRVLMTTALRERIKSRDKYTCQHCGLSVRDEPNLLLEIDHIIPLSKGGITEESNLQTLCWKCNRHKGNKIF